MSSSWVSRYLHDAGVHAPIKGDRDLENSQAPGTHLSSDTVMRGHRGLSGVIIDFSRLDPTS